MENEVFNIFLDILQASAKKHGKDYPVTLGHLFHIADLAKKLKDARDQDYQDRMEQAMNEVFEDQHKYGTND